MYTFLVKLAFSNRFQFHPEIHGKAKKNRPLDAGGD
jgi:hypothetical protein